ncbi:MAG: ComF family protein [Candidatus Yanofskybacteria bacterium]|nr:ComF family protein [Candidatus Yanofskybacteria bacterium]
MPNYTQKTVNWILDIIFPKKCLDCNKFTHSTGSTGSRQASSGQAADFDYACRKCFGEIGLKNNLECVGCKRQTRLGFTCAFCDKFNKTDQLIITADLTDPLVEKILKAYKYKFIQSMVLPLSVLARRRVKKLLSKKFSLFGDNPLLIPVPLHKRRLNERGFNQAELLAENLADTYHLICESNILTRVANPKHQAEIKKKEERLENVKNNFRVKNIELIRSKTIILVDDICTSGATLNECARVLKESGAKRVIGFVLARGQFKK